MSVPQLISVISADLDDAARAARLQEALKRRQVLTETGQGSLLIDAEMDARERDLIQIAKRNGSQEIGPGLLATLDGEKYTDRALA